MGEVYFRRDEAIAELKKRGIRLSIGGCGCCGSPWFALEIDGEMYIGGKADGAGDSVNTVDGYSIDMFEPVTIESIAQSLPEQPQLTILDKYPDFKPMGNE